MRIYMLHLLLIASLFGSAITSFGQVPNADKQVAKIPEPLFILNSNIIGNGLVSQLNPRDFKKMIVYKNQDGPGVLKNLTSSGIIAITYDKPISSKSFAEIASENGVPGLCRFILNGQPLDTAQVAALRIAPEAIGQLHVTQATSSSSGAVVTIQTVKSKTASQKNAPGTIMIR